MPMYESIEGCNIEIMGYPFYVEKVSANEAYRRREINLNPIVGGTLKASKGQYVGLDFKITTHVRVDPNKPHVHNKIFREMMSKPVTVTSPELGGSFTANVVITPDHSKLNFLQLDISIKEIPGSKSKIPGESWTVPKTKKIDLKKKNKNNDSKTDTKKGSKTSGKKGNSKRNTAGKKSKANTGKKK